MNDKVRKLLVLRRREELSAARCELSSARADLGHALRALGQATHWSWLLAVGALKELTGLELAPLHELDARPVVDRLATALQACVCDSRDPVLCAGAYADRACRCPVCHGAVRDLAAEDDLRAAFVRTVEVAVSHAGEDPDTDPTQEGAP